MPVDPAIQPILDAANATAPLDTGASVDKQRATVHQVMEASFVGLAEAPPEVHRIVDHTVPVDGGTITVRVYTPPGDGPFPVHVHFHGGAFWLGELAHFDGPCQELCMGAQCIVASVDYRLAPEHKFPTAPEDCYTALCWVMEHADKLSVDPTSVSVGGGSAGGDLAAVVALMARDRDGPPLVLQVLEIPVTDLTMGKPSIEENGEGYLLTRTAIEQYCDYYLAEPADAKHPYASPLLADDLSDLPPAFVTTAEYDPLRDEGEAYAQRLVEAGVPTRHKRWLGHVHGSAAFTSIMDSARQYRAELIAAVRDAHRRR